MEIKIIISASAPGASTEASSLQVSGGGSGASSAGESGTTGQSGTAGGAGESRGASQTAAPPDLLRAAAALGAINAGPGPTMTSASQFDGPMPYIGSSVGTQLAVPSAGATQVTTESAGPAPGSGSSDAIEITSAPEGTGY